MFSVSQADRKSLGANLDDWLLKSFLKAPVQSIWFYFIKFEGVNANAVIDPITEQVSLNLASFISEKNRDLDVGGIDWLSLYGKRYSLIVFDLTQKSHADAMIVRDFFEVGKENDTTYA